MKDGRVKPEGKGVILENKWLGNFSAYHSL